MLVLLNLFWWDHKRVEIVFAKIIYLEMCQSNRNTNQTFSPQIRQSNSCQASFLEWVNWPRNSIDRSVKRSKRSILIWLIQVYFVCGGRPFYCYWGATIGDRVEHKTKICVPWWTISKSRSPGRPTLKLMIPISGRCAMINKNHTGRSSSGGSLPSMSNELDWTEWTPILMSLAASSWL